jgi:hypothetical protein
VTGCRVARRTCEIRDWGPENVAREIEQSRWLLTQHFDHHASSHTYGKLRLFNSSGWNFCSHVMVLSFSSVASFNTASNFDPKRSANRQRPVRIDRSPFSRCGVKAGSLPRQGANQRWLSFTIVHHPHKIFADRQIPTRQRHDRKCGQEGKSRVLTTHSECSHPLPRAARAIIAPTDGPHLWHEIRTL